MEGQWCYNMKGFSYVWKGEMSLQLDKSIFHVGNGDVLSHTRQDLSLWQIIARFVLFKKGGYHYKEKKRGLNCLKSLENCSCKGGYCYIYVYLAGQFYSFKSYLNSYKAHHTSISWGGLY
jgi:hypothetical protein